MSANYTGCVDAAWPLPDSNAYENFLGDYVPSNAKPPTPDVASTLESISCANGEALFTRSWDYFQNGPSSLHTPSDRRRPTPRLHL